MLRLFSLSLILLFLIHSCKAPGPETIDVKLGGDYDCSILDEVITRKNIKTIKIIRPMGLMMDTTTFNPLVDSSYFGPRLISFGNQYLACRSLRSNPLVDIDSVLWIYALDQEKNFGDWMTQERVKDYWEHDNHAMLGKKSKEFSAEDGRGSTVEFSPTNKGLTILHFGNLACSGSQQAVPALEKLKIEFPDVEVIHIFRDEYNRYDELVLADSDSLKLLIDFGRDTVAVHSPIYRLEEELQDLYQVSAFSTSLLIDSSGVIRSVSKGSYIRQIRDSLINYYPKTLLN